MDVNNLEGAIGSAKGEGSVVSKEQEIGFHKGAVNTLSSERNELIKMIRNVEGIMGAHLKRLKELGVEVK